MKLLFVLLASVVLASANRVPAESLQMIAKMGGESGRYVNEIRKREDPYIINGEPIGIADRNFQVIFRHYDTFVCGGSIITENIVMTAGHCVVDMELSDMTVTAGTTYVSNGGVTVQVESFILHPQYDDWYLDYDVALLHLAEPLRGENIGTIKVALEGGDLDIGKPVNVSGWGLNENNRLPDDLHIVELDIIGNDDCTRRLRDQISDNMVCAFAPDKDSCSGDSGSPLTYTAEDGSEVQVGIVSWGPSKCGSNPGVYTRLSYPGVRQFIREHAGV